MEDGKYQEPEETTTGATTDQPPVQAEVVPDVQMLTDEPVIDRSHANVEQNGPTTDEWTPPPFNGNTEEEETGSESKEESEYTNPEISELDPAEKEEGAEYMADFALEAYGETKRELGNLFIPISMRRLRKLEEKGDIDLSIMLESRDGTRKPAMDYVVRYNEKATDVFKLRPNFVTTVRPILVKEFAKKGIALGPWQRVGLAVAMDLKEDGKIAVGLYNEAERIIDALKETTAAYQNYQNNHSTMHAGPGGQQQSPVSHQQPVQSGQQVQTPSAETTQVVTPIDTTQQREQTIASEFERIQEENKGQGGAMPVMPDEQSSVLSRRKPIRKVGKKGKRKSARKKVNTL